MKEFILDNGMKLIYENRPSMLTSVSIGLEAGASVEDWLLGLAHATEHMIFKGTKTRSEKTINEELSKIFGFSNAMTNFPYVIYYGTLLGEDLYKGLDIFSDILLNPSFPIEGFKEEMDSIKEELNEWDEELQQFCEDKLLIHSFNKNRLKYPIIGRMEDLNKITLEDIKEFYKRYYSPKNAVISIVSALPFEEVKEKVERYFGGWQGEEVEVQASLEVPRLGEYIDFRESINSCRVEMIFTISNLTHEEIKSFRIFNEFFGEGMNSILFDILRTKNGLVYDVITTISNEKHIGLYKIEFSTSKEKLDKSLTLVKEAFNNVEKYEKDFTKEKIEELYKSIKLKKLFKEEQSIRLANSMTTYAIMFKDTNIFVDMLEGIEKLTSKDIINAAKKVLKNPSIEIIMPRGLYE